MNKSTKFFCLKFQSSRMLCIETYLISTKVSEKNSTSILKVDQTGVEDGETLPKHGQVGGL